jgi:hypothetical protein
MRAPVTVGNVLGVRERSALTDASSAFGCVAAMSLDLDGNEITFNRWWFALAFGRWRAALHADPLDDFRIEKPSLARAVFDRLDLGLEHFVQLVNARAADRQAPGDFGTA